MFRFFCFLLIFFKMVVLASTYDTYLKALQEKEPNNLFDECVNIISGNFVFDDEIIAEGKEPIKLKRSYFSLNNFDQRYKDKKSHDEYILAGWSYHKVTKAFFYGDRIDIVQPSSVVYSFQIPYNKSNKKAKKKKEQEPLLQTLIYKSTSYLPNFYYKKDVRLIDPKELVVQLKGQNELFVFYPDGTQKYYKKQSNQLNEYLLRSETLLNQNKIQYFYDDLNRLKEIRSTNPLQNKVYAWVKFNYSHFDPEYKEKHKDKHDFTILTSDGKRYEFRHNNYYPIVSHKERSIHPFFILENVNSNQFNENLNYHLEYKNTHPLLKRATLPNKQIKEVGYYLLGDKNPEVGIQFFDVDDLRFERVKILYEPVGANGAFHSTYRFYYDQGKTTIYDSCNNKLVYYYNADSKITRIQRFENKNGKYVLLNEERFVWRKVKEVPLLIAKAFLDADSEPIFAKRYFYDNNNNLIEERIYGNISGSSKKPGLDGQDLPKDGSDVFVKRYKYTNDKRHLLIEMSDDNKIVVKYCYLPNTNIISSKIVLYDSKVKKRYFYEYNSDYHLIKKIIDDSSSLNKNEINCSFRKIKYLYPKTSGPFYGFIEVLEEKYLDLETLKEKLYKKEVYSYSSFGKVIKKDIYDSNNRFAYSYFYEYDTKGNLISKTDPIGKKSIYRYDANNNKIAETLPNGTTVLNSYNLCNQLIKKEVQKENQSLKSSYFYDTCKNRTVFRDALNNEIKYEYDNFSNLTNKTSIKPVDGKSLKTEEKYNYDAKGNKSQIDQNQNIKKITYNIYFDPVLIIYPDNTQERFIYNLDGSLKTFIDKEGVQTQFSYDFLKRVTNKKIVSPDGDLLEEEVYRYNSFGLEEKKDKKQTIKYYYDFFKRLIKKEIIWVDDIYTEKYFYDDLSRKNKTIYNDTYVEIAKRDLLGRIIEIERKTLNGFIFYKKSYRYDDLDNLNIISYIEDKKSIEKHYFDGFRRLSKVVDALGGETFYGYDNSFIFSDVELVKKTNQANQIELIDKDEKRVLLEKKTFDGKVFYREENRFDGLNNLMMKKYVFNVGDREEKKEVFYSYDNMNRLVSCLEKGNDFEKETGYVYTKKGYIKTIIKPDGIILEKKYDYLGNVLKLTSSDGKCSYGFEYNDLDLPVKVTDLNSNLQTIRKYNGRGKLIEEKFANGLEIKKDYDLLGRKTNVMYPDGSCAKYFYEPFYLKKVVRQDLLSQDIYHHNYLKYDLSGNLLQEELIGDLGITNQRLDLLGRHVLIDTPFGVEKSEKYNPIGEVEKIDWKILWGIDSIFQYEDFNRVKKRNDFENAGPSKIEYDPNGNIISIENEKRIFYSYDALNRLIKIQRGDHMVEFSYDGLNRKITKSIYELNKNKKIHLLTLRYLYDEFEEVGVYNNKDYQPLELKILGRKENEKTKSIAYEILDEIYLPLYDIFGNVSSLISLNKGLVEACRYSFWKESLTFLSFDRRKKYANPWRYFEKIMDEDINLLCFDTIFYDPIERKLLNPTPINLISKDIENISVLQMQGETSVKDKEKITSFEVMRNKAFLDFNTNIFSRNTLDLKKEKISFSKKAAIYMAKENIKLPLILEAIKKPVDIQKIEDSKFSIVYRKMKILIDLESKEVLNIEKLD